MARIVLGDQSRVDPEVLAALETLSDDFWVLGEFTLRRNFDWFILRAFDDSPAALIVTEVKRRTRPLRGSLNAAWEEPTASGEWEIIQPPNGEDRNFYWQAVNAANSLSEWLRNNEPVFNGTHAGAWADARVWPDLLILSPPGITHLLPHRPDNGFGAWFVDLERWLSHVKTWRPRVGPRLTQTHIQRLVDHFQLTPAPTSPAPRVAEAEATGVLQPAASLSRTVEDLTRRVARLESVLQHASRSLAAAGEPLSTNPTGGHLTQVPITLNHTIVPSHDKERAAGFFARVFGLEYAGSDGHFAPVRVNATLTLDWDTSDRFEGHHYAFLVDDQEFDAIFERLRHEDVRYGSEPDAPANGEINTRLGGRGLYFVDPDGHLLEIMTRA